MGHNFADRSLDHPHRQAELLVLAGRALGMSQEKLGELLGVSRRTMTRWTSRGTTLARDDATTLARALHDAGHAELAERAAATCRQTLASLGMAPQVVAEPPSPKLVEIVVCAAAEALDASPRTVRPMLRAAFGEADVLGLSVQDVVQGLSPALAVRVPHATKAKRR